MMKINKKLLFIAIFIILTMCTICFADSKITKDFELTSYSSYNNNVYYGINIEEKSLTINASDYNLPSNLYNFKDYIRLRVTYSQDTYEISNCEVINYVTDEIIEDTSEENIDKLFNIEYGKSINEKSWTDTVKLSEIEENKIYKYTASSTTQFPEIENDVEDNCFVFIKGNHDTTYERNIYMYKNIVSSSSISFSDNEYKAGESFTIMYCKVSNKELLKFIEEDDIIYLSNYNDGDELDISFEKYIYNDTGNDILINYSNTIFETESSSSITIEKGEIYGFDWMINSASISYLVNSNIQNNTNTNTNTNANTNTNTNTNINTNTNSNISSNTNNTTYKNTSTEDNTTSTEQLPQTGSLHPIMIILTFISITVVMLACYKKYYDNKNI